MNGPRKLLGLIESICHGDVGLALRLSSVLEPRKGNPVPVDESTCGGSKGA
jgi:hypothetical protein